MSKKHTHTHTVTFTWSSLVPATHHGAHAEPHALVLVHHVGQQLGRGRHGDALLVAELIDATLAGQQALPEAAVGRSSGHGAQQVGVDLDHLLDRLGGDVGARGGPGVHGDDDAMVELGKITDVFKLFFVVSLICFEPCFNASS